VRLSEPYPAGSGLVQEDFLVTGATGIAADTDTITSRFKPRSIKGGIAVSISGAVLTYKMGVDLGNSTAVVSVVADTR
jgi:hypothetical protein